MFFRKETINEKFERALSKNDFYLLKLACQRAKAKMNLSKRDLRIINLYELSCSDEIINIKFNLGIEYVNHYLGHNDRHKVKLF